MFVTRDVLHFHTRIADHSTEHCVRLQKSQDALGMDGFVLSLTENDFYWLAMEIWEISRHICGRNSRTKGPLALCTATLTRARDFCSAQHLREMGAPRIAPSSPCLGRSVVIW